MLIAFSRRDLCAFFLDVDVIFQHIALMNFMCIRSWILSVFVRDHFDDSIRFFDDRDIVTFVIIMIFVIYNIDFQQI